MVDFTQSPQLFFRAVVAADALAAPFFPFVAASVAAKAMVTTARFELVPFFIVGEERAQSRKLGCKNKGQSKCKEEDEDWRGRRRQMASKKNLPAPFSLFTAKSKNNLYSQSKIVRST